MTFIKLPFVVKIFVLSIFERVFYTGFTVYASILKSVILKQAMARLERSSLPNLTHFSLFSTKGEVLLYRTLKGDFKFQNKLLPKSSNTSPYLRAQAWSPSSMESKMILRELRECLNSSSSSTVQDSSGVFLHIENSRTHVQKL